ncbi:MAG TPA: glycosyltransferase [Rhizobiaceae bacterium]|nr:glycosyltransferase [Rhizobiaceae bacterium]
MSEPVEHLKISLVTPNFNGEKHLRKAINSVISQEYPKIEYIIVDGGSNDGSVQIAKKFGSAIKRIVSEKDRGHTNAINKGFRLTTGEIMGWLNSDDILFPGSLELVNEIFSRNPDVAWLTGRAVGLAESGMMLTMRDARPWSWLRFLGRDFRHIPQESTFWRRSLWEKAGGLDEQFGIASDFELWTRFFRHAHLFSVDAPIGGFRFREEGQLSRAAGDDNSSSVYDRLCEAALANLLRDIPAAALARQLENLPADLPLQNSFNFAEVAPSLAAIDPPIFRSVWSARTYRKAGTVAPVAENYRVTKPQAANLAFSGSERGVWRSGPSFRSNRVIGVDIEFSSDEIKSHGAAVDQHTPPMPFVLGNLALYDRGAGTFELQLKFEPKPLFYKFEADLNRPIHLKVAFGQSDFLVSINGEILARGALPGEMAAFEEWTLLGAGFLDRAWRGAFARVEVYTRPVSSDGSIAYWALAHDPVGKALVHEKIDATGKAQLAEFSLPARTKTRDGDIARFRNVHRGERCFVMGNGPSLNKMDLNKLSNEIVFGCNAVFLLFERIAWRPKYFVCVDTRVLRDRAADITAMLDENPEMIAFFPEQLTLHDGSKTIFETRDIIPPARNRYFLREIQNSLSAPPRTMFSLDANEYIVQPYTVSVSMLQLAHYMGFSPIYLIGCDTSYSVGGSVRQDGQKLNGVGLLLTSTKDDDANHFDPRYFGAGREWHNPQVGGMIMHHGWARKSLERAGTQVFNATIGGQLEVYRRVDYDSLF